MAQLLDPITSRDFSSGRIAKSAVATALMPNFSSHTLQAAVNSVSNSENVDFSEIIGSGIVRKGKTKIITITGNQVDGETERVANGGDELEIHDSTIQAQTFTPTSGETNTTGIVVRLYLVGDTAGLSTPANVVVSLNATSAGNPTASIINGNVWTFPAALIPASSTGTIFVFPTSPGTVLTASTTYAIVIQFQNGDSGTYVEWIRNASTTYAGGHSQTSTNNGGSWSNNTGAFYFSQQIFDTNTSYNFPPLGNYSFLSNGLKKNVIAYEINDQGLQEGAIYYYNVITSSWQVSDLTMLNASAPVRFANMNGYVFEANGMNQMMSSADFGATWGVSSCILPYDLRTAQLWNSGVSYGVGAVVTYGSFYYVSLVGSNENNEPDDSPDDWQLITNIVGGLYPSLLIVAGNRMLAAGVPLYPSRVYFSALVNPAASPPSAFLTWNVDPILGDFIDINPDDGGVVTGFANNSTLTLVFKNNAMYRLNAISKTVDPENVFNVGCVSQEAIVNCLGITYFYSGNGIYSTDGTFPQLISRIAVQDYVNAITNPQHVYASTDGFNVYFSIGAITITFGPEDTRTYSNVVLKFSPRDQNWQILTYQQQIGPMSEFGLIPLDTILATQFNGDLSTMNSANFSDDGAAISYSLETQEQEFGNRAHTKDISDKIVVYNRLGGDGMFLVKQNDGNFKSANIQANGRVNVGTDVNFEAEFFTFRWEGQALGQRPIFEGYHLPVVTDLGVNKNSNTLN